MVMGTRFSYIYVFIYYHIKKRAASFFCIVVAAHGCECNFFCVVLSTQQCEISDTGDVMLLFPIVKLFL